MDEKKLYTFTETCEILRIKRSSLSRYLRLGSIGCYRPAGKMRCLFSQAHIDDFLRESERKPVYKLVEELRALLLQAAGKGGEK